LQLLSAKQKNKLTAENYPEKLAELPCWDLPAATAKVCYIAKACYCKQGVRGIKQQQCILFTIQ